MELQHLPHAPGVYLMRDSAARILYVGKAKNLKKRVSSYFQKRDLHPRIFALVSLIRHVDYIPTASERDALVLEQNLIRRFQPLYNTMWKDDKSYPYVKLSANEDYPRLFLTRKKEKDRALYFGPYPNVHSVRQLLRTLWRKKLIRLRPCRFPFREKDIVAKGGLAVTRVSLYKKVKSCIYLHTGECPAPCVGRISRRDYGLLARKASLFFRGKRQPLLADLERAMRTASENLEYEKAASLRDQIAAMEHMAEKVSIRETDEKSVAGHVLASRALTEIQEHLGLPRPPMRIEGFDISNIQGTEPVGSMSVFVNGRPETSEYRKFKIRTVQGQDDFAMMGEVLTRRLRRIAGDDLPRPGLILIDGGKGQLSAAVRALEAVRKSAGIQKIPIVSLAKEEEEIHLPDRPEPLKLPKDSPALHILQAVRDEAHRFAVTFHRQRRTRSFRQMALCFLTCGLLTACIAPFLHARPGKVFFDSRHWIKGDIQIQRDEDGREIAVIAMETGSITVPRSEIKTIIYTAKESARDRRFMLSLDKTKDPSPPSKSRGTLYDPYIRSAGNRHKIDPDLLRAVVKQESDYDQRSTSCKGARGLMQLMPETAKGLGVSDIYDPWQNLHGGALYLRYMLETFNGDLELAPAAYNAGPNAVKKYGKIPPYRETQDYVRKVMGYYQMYQSDGLSVYEDKDGKLVITDRPYGP